AGLRHALGIFAALFCHAAVAQPAKAEPQRVVSLNVCTDQLLLALADEGQILALSPFAKSASISYFANKAGAHDHVARGAEDVMLRQPDLVLAGTFTARETRERLAEQGIPVTTFAPVRSLNEARDAIRQTGALLGQEQRAADWIARLDEAITRASESRPDSPTRALFYQRRGFVSGTESLMTDIFAAVGLDNHAARYGRKRTGTVRLETIIADPPDLMVLSRLSSTPEDQGLALTLHRALVEAVPLERRLALPERLTICGGPSLVEALDHLSEALGRRVSN
ncbi:MAG: ABC transporter substrate-binding protein, partial [Pseudomonadota bacterium]